MKPPPLLTHRALTPVWALLLAAVVLLPWLSQPGLWEPQEMKVADRAMDRAVEQHTPAEDEAAPEQAKDDSCPRQPADDDGPGTLTEQLVAAGIDLHGDRTDAGAEVSFIASEAVMRAHLALLGLLLVMAIYGITARLATPRAGLFASLIALSFPLLVLQARQLTSEIGTPAGAALIVYGAVALMRPARWPLAIPDVVVALASLAGGLAVAYLGGGAFLGLLPPLAALALAGGLGMALVPAAWRVVRHLAIAILPPRHRIGRERPLDVGMTGRELAAAAVALVAFVAVLVVGAVLVVQIYDLQERAPGTREVLGQSLFASGCWSEALGGVWKFNDDAKSFYHSMFEQVAFGMFPWGVLAPVALLGLALGHVGDERRHLGRLALAWAALAWIVGTVYQRKVGFTIYAGFPACAIGIGAWLDGFFGQRRDYDAAPGCTDGRKLQTTGLLVGLWVLLGMLALAKDLQAFPEKLTSLLIGGDQIKYPNATVLGVKLRLGLLLLGAWIGGAFALACWAWWPRESTRWRDLNRHAGWLLGVALALTALTGVFWAQVWQRTLSKSLSSKHVFAVYQDLREDGDVLGIMGDMGNAPRYYAGGEWETLKGQAQLMEFLDTEQRVFALAPAGELCTIHKAVKEDDFYYVLDDSNARYLLLSNTLPEGEVDRNPLSTMVLREPPEGIRTEFHATFDDKVELIGFAMPPRAELRGQFTMTLYFKVLAPPKGQWKIFVHFDPRGGPARFQGDHEPIRGRCKTSDWQKGDYIVDTFEVEAGDITMPSGTYDVRVGFFTGSSPNWKNMKVTEAPPNTRDDADRVLIGTIQVD